jgi:hypothetical protein
VTKLLTEETDFGSETSGHRRGDVANMPEMSAIGAKWIFAPTVTAIALETHSLRNDQSRIGLERDQPSNKSYQGDHHQRLNHCHGLQQISTEANWARTRNAVRPHKMVACCRRSYSGLLSRC